MSCTCDYEGQRCHFANFYLFPFFRITSVSQEEEDRDRKRLECLGSKFIYRQKTRKVVYLSVSPSSCSCFKGNKVVIKSSVKPCLTQSLLRERERVSEI